MTGELTGPRSLDGYAGDEDQCRALLEAGATVASAWGLRPGIAQTAEQMAQLTSDIVWLVEQTTTPADGSTTTALVPQVYLRVQPGDLADNGALLAGANVCRLPVNLIQAFLEASGQTSPKETTDAQEQVHRESDRYDIEAG